jgi:hypothetical protein
LLTVTPTVAADTVKGKEIQSDIISAAMQINAVILRNVLLIKKHPLQKIFAILSSLWYYIFAL